VAPSSLQFGLEPDAIYFESGDGNIASTIVAEAKAWAAQLIVMGTHGRHGIKRLAMGSDAEDVVRETRIPVLLVHDGSANTPEAQLTERNANSPKQVLETASDA
jgi:hypothetical protein